MDEYQKKVQEKIKELKEEKNKITDTEPEKTEYQKNVEVKLNEIREERGYIEYTISNPILEKAKENLEELHEIIEVKQKIKKFFRK